MVLEYYVNPSIADRSGKIPEAVNVRFQMCLLSLSCWDHCMVNDVCLRVNIIKF